jgi:phenylalanyl-tRNA synthetase beta chain
VSIQAPDLCPRYVARLIRNVKLGPSPWLVQFRVLAAGMRPVNNIVDATNYVMLEYGQPLHAFDFARLEGRHIVVRRSEVGESLVTLDGARRDLPAGALVIADERKAIAVAGVMGGEESEVKAVTKDILIESASFDPGAVRRAVSGLGLPSEASGRFEKGTDPQGVEAASARAAGLIAEIAGGAVAPGSVDANPVPYQTREVVLRTPRVSALLGLSLDSRTIASLLELLGFASRPQAWASGERESVATELVVLTPSWRTDVAGEVDLIEEVARLHGYDRIPETLPGGAATVGAVPPLTRLENRVRKLLVDYGFHETIGLSLVDPAEEALLGQDGPPLALANPLSGRQSVMRTSLLGGLVEGLARNLDRAERNLRLLEIGTVYHPTHGDLGPSSLPVEKRLLAAVALGPGPEVSWRDAGRAPDFFYVKGLVEVSLRELGVAGYRLMRGADQRFHPGRQAVVRVPVEAGSDGATVEVGVFGELHPRALGSYGIAERVVALELDLGLAGSVSTVRPRAQEALRYPTVTRDVAVILSEDVEAAAIEEVITCSAGELCAAVELFDLYLGHPVPEGQRSTAWRVTYRAADRSLTDSEVDEVHARVRQALGADLGAILR